MIEVGFEPTPFRTSALSWRLRPLGHPTSSQLYSNQFSLSNLSIFSLYAFNVNICLAEPIMNEKLGNFNEILKNRI